MRGVLREGSGHTGPEKGVEEENETPRPWEARVEGGNSESTISLSLRGVTSIVSLPSYSPSISHDWDLTDLRTLGDSCRTESSRRSSRLTVKSQLPGAPPTLLPDHLPRIIMDNP